MEIHIIKRGLDSESIEDGQVKTWSQGTRTQCISCSFSSLKTFFLFCFTVTIPGFQLMSTQHKYADFIFHLADMGCSLEISPLRDGARALLKIIPAGESSPP